MRVNVPAAKAISKSVAQRQPPDLSADSRRHSPIRVFCGCQKLRTGREAVSLEPGNGRIENDRIRAARRGYVARNRRTAPWAGPGQVGVTACGVCSWDIWTHRHGQDSTHPTPPDQEAVGRVHAVGFGIEDTRVGQLVAVRGGGFCDFCNVPAQKAYPLAADLLSDERWSVLAGRLSSSAGSVSSWGIWEQTGTLRA